MTELIPQTTEQPLELSQEDQAGFEDPSFVASVMHSNLPELDTEGNTGVMNALTKGIPSLLYGATETLGDSFGIVTPEEYQQTLKANMPETYNYYKRNEGGVKLIADIATAFIPATAGVKAIQGGSWLHRIMKAGNVPMTDKLFTSNSKFNTYYRRLREQDRTLAKRGAIGAEFAEGRKIVARNFKKRKAIDGVKEGLAAEIAIYGALSDSQVLYPDDLELTTHLSFAALGAALPVGINYLVARRLVANAAKKVSPEAIAALNVGGKSIDKIVARPGEENIPITLLATSKAGMEDEARTLRTAAAGDLEAQRRADNIHKFATEVDKKTHELIDKLTKHKVPGLIEGDNPDHVAKTLKASLKADQISLLGVVAANPVPVGNREILSLIERRVSSIEAAQADYDNLYKSLLGNEPYITAQKNLTKEELKQLNTNADDLLTLKQHDLFVMSPRGEYIPLSEYSVLFRDDLSPLKPQLQNLAPMVTGETAYRYSKVGPENHELTVDIGLSATINNAPIKEGLHTIDNYSVDALYDLYSTAIQRAAQSRQKILVDDNEHWLRADAIVEYAKTLGPQAENLIQFFGKETRNLEDLRMQALTSKFEEYRDLHKTIGEAGDEAGITAESLRHRFNLPAWSRGEANPTEELFLDLIQQGVTKKLPNNSLRDWIPNYSDFKAMAGRRLTFASPDLDGSLVTDIPTMGTQFAPRSDTPNVLVYKKYLGHDAYTVQRLEDSVFKQVETALNFDAAIQSGSKLVGRIADLVTKSGAYAVAKNVKELSDSARLGTGVINTSRFSTRALPTMEAAHALQTVLEKETRTFVAEQLYDAPNKIASELAGKPVSHATVFSELRSNKNLSDLVSFSSYVNARRHAWDLLPEPHTHDDGMVSFFLDPNSKNNYNKLREQFGEDMAQELLPASDDIVPPLMPATGGRAGEYQPLRVTARAYAAADAFRDMGRKVRDELNLLQKQKSIPEIGLKQWWVPPEHFANLHVAFLVHPIANNQMRKVLVKGRTASELQKNLNSESVRKFRKENPGTMQFTAEDFERYFSLRDDVVFNGMEEVDSSLFAAGRTAQLTPDDGRAYLDGAVDFLRDQVGSISKRTMATLFEPQLNFADMMSGLSIGKNKLYRNIYEEYKDTLLGSRGLNEQYGLGKVYMSAESLYDDILTKLYDQTEGRRSVGFIKERVSRSIGHLNRQLERVRKELGNDIPVELTADELARITNIKPPPSMQKHMAAINQLTSAMVLRIAEVAHPLLNFSGVVNTMPGIIHALQRKHGESRPDWVARISAFGTPLSNTQDLSALSPVKLMAQGTYHGFTKQGTEDWAEMVKRGYGRQEVAEIQKTITNPQSVTSVSEVIDKLSILSDKSEELSRGWAHMAGIKIAREHLNLTDVNDAHIFAHKFANEVIGDYRASNRPQIFQGAVGMPLGLFQTYIWNYYQRLFGYIENRQYGALGWQAFTQASVFGAASLPGFRQFQETWTQAEKGEDPITTLNRKLGPDTAELLLNGTLSNIPKIFSDDGIALYTRGDTNFQRMPAFLDPRQAPIWQLATRSFNTVRDSVDQHLSGGQFSWQRQMEILGTYSMNRPVSRWIELASGYSVDRRGQVISDDTLSGLSVAARVMSMRPLNEQKQIETLWRQRQTEYTQRALRKRTRDGLRSKIREGSVDEAAIKEVLRDYIIQGGNPASFTNFLKDQILASKSPKITNQVLRLLNAGKLNEAARLYGVLE